MNLIFKDKEHEKLFENICSQMNNLDCYHGAVAYLIALDNVLKQHIKDIFDFESDCIKHDALQKAWNTSSSCKSLRLAFNLWNGCYFDEEEPNSTCKGYAVDEIFCNEEYAEYYWVAVKLRFNY